MKLERTHLKFRRLLTPLCIAAFAAVFLAPLACALYREDRCLVEEAQYKIAHQLYVESESLDLVERQLKEMGWPRCKVNEAKYRLKKEFEVVK